MKTQLLTLSLTFLCFFLNAQNEPTDCVNALTLCGNTRLELNSNGTGINDFASPNNQAPDCGFDESQSLWIRFTIVQSGTLAFTITPESPNPDEDYDFAIYGPNVTCDNLGSSVRCSSTNPRAANVPTLTGLNDIETDISEGPGPLGNGFIRSLDVLAGEEYYVLIDNFSQNGGFALDFTGTALLPSSPINEAGTANLDLTECDAIADYDDGMTFFDLENNTAAILGSQLTTSVTYHLTENEAALGNNPLASPYISTQNNQTIHVRIENTTTGCFVLDAFQLIVPDGPAIATPTPYVLCDDESNDGVADFLMNTKDVEVLNGLDPATNSISYHLTQNEAIAGTGAIDKNNVYQNVSNPQTLFARAEDVSNTCVGWVNFDLLVNTRPEANPISLVQCDQDANPNDGITIFNLDQSILQITGNVPDRNVLFYESQADVNSNNPIANTTTYTNTAPNQQLLVRVTDINTQCFSDTTINLTVSVTSANDANLNACDDDEDGFMLFDLTEANEDVLAGIVNSQDLTITYHPTVADALSETNPIENYTNTISGTQGQEVVYVRVEDNQNQCFGINEIALFVNNAPEITQEEEILLCRGESTVIDSGLPSTVNLSDFTFEWSTGETSESIQINEPNDYFVTVTDMQTSCSANRLVTVLPSEAPTIIDIKIEDDGNDIIVEAIVDGIGDYEYAIEINGELQPYQDASVFFNVPPGFHRVFVREKNSCGEAATDVFPAIDIPEYFTPNGDSFHEIWKIEGLSNEVFGNTLIYIFDRYGKLLKQLSPGGSGWNGEYNGRIMPSSEYWYRIELEQGLTFKGSFSLIR